MAAENTLFLDRDGVLNHAVIREGEISSPRKVEEFRLADDIDALREPWVEEKWNLVIISNQPDLSRGWISAELLHHFHSMIADRISLNAIYLCPHLRADQCDCRKPACGLIHRFRREHPLNGKELFIGDRESDLKCAIAAQAPFVLRCRPYNKEIEETADYTINHLSEIKTIINEETK